MTEEPILLVKTVQANVFSLLNEALKDILYEVNFKFTETGIVIKAMNISHSQFVYLNLEASKFETYVCKRPITVGIDMVYLYKLIRGVTNDDVLVLSLNESNTSSLKISIINEYTNISKNYDLKLLDIDEQEHENLPYNEDSPKFIVNIGTQRFKSICKELSVISDTIEITCTDKEIKFECNGLSAKGSQVIELDNNNQYAFVTRSCDDIIQGIFSLKTLCQFTKFSNLCNHVELCISNDEPIYVKYACADLGSITLFLAPYDETD